ncbi:MAG: hypothetical protein R3263_10970, partial [Myxococcota bacterium]|nr:hypothetical protein [Myxococcota bacterium]
RERALRRAGDTAGLEALLAERCETTDDPAVRDRLRVERAELLEALEREAEARALWTAVADAGGEAAEEAEARLERLLERAGDAAALRARIERRLEGASGDDAVALHERAARLARDHLGDREGAIAHLEAAAAQAPDRPALWRALAQLYRECDRPADWLRVLEAELATGPDEERARLLHARAAELARRSGEEDRAAGHYEALLALDPAHAEAVEYLAARHEAHGDVAKLAEVLTRRLEALSEADRAAGADTALCLRIAALHADAGHPDDAIALLEEAAERPDALLLVAEPLADLYQQAGRRDALVALAGRARDAAEAPEERAGWALRLGDALRAVGDYGAAAEAYRRVRVDRPDDPDAEAALRDLYRRLGESEALVRLQEARLARVGGEEEIPLRLELAELLDGALGRPAPALAHLRRVLELAPDHAEALARALETAERARDPQALAALLDHALVRRRDAAGRARLLARRAALYDEDDAGHAPAVACLREALALAPGDARIRRALRRRLEAAGDTAGVLAVREAELAALPADDVGARAELCEEAASLASSRLGGDAALPWLLRLRRLRPGDPGPLRRIAALHREAGRTAALLRSLEEERDLSPQRPRLAEIERERG